MEIKTFRTKFSEETINLAKKMAKEIPLGTLIMLKGDIGAGKTTFTKGLAEGFGISDIVNSPTFNIVREYKINDNNILYHLDLYRLNDINSLLSFGIEDYLYQENAITIVEWPELLAPFINKNLYNIVIELVIDNIENEERIIKITKFF